MGPQTNKSEQVFSDGHPMSLAGGPGPGPEGVVSCLMPRVSWDWGGPIFDVQGAGLAPMYDVGWGRGVNQGWGPVQ